MVFFKFDFRVRVNSLIYCDLIEGLLVVVSVLKKGLVSGLLIILRDLQA